MSNLNAPVEEYCGDCEAPIHESEGRYRYSPEVVKCERCGDKSPILNKDGML